MIRDHPVVGIGPDNFLHYYAPRHQLYLQCNRGLGYMDSRASVEPCISHPHDEVLDLWLSSGILGLSAFVWLQFVFWKNAWLSYAGKKGIMRVLLAGTMAAMLAGLVHGLVDNSYFLEDLSLLFWMFCAFVSYTATATEASR
jgi:O-antigen ligase